MTDAPPPEPALNIPTGLGPCSTCKYWDSPDAVEGRCRFDAPSPQPVSNRANWPVCRANDWCGKWVVAS